MKEFSKEVIENLGYYVYALIDPRRSCPNRIFYVGKGNDNRCFAHAAQKLEESALTVSPPKLEIIQKITQETGEPPPVEIIAHRLDELEAYRLESILIKLLPNLSNSVTGHHANDYWLTAQQIETRYSDPIEASEIEVPFLLVSLNGNPKIKLPAYPQIANQPEVLKSRTLGNWPVAPEKARKVRLVLGVYRGLVRTVFRVGLDRNGDAKLEVISPEKARACRRVRFTGESDKVAEEKFLGRQIVDQQGRSLSILPPGSSRRLVTAPTKGTV
jgi:hypothetical protein